MPSSLDFQTIILKLQEYWAEKGCLIAQPYYTQVGAGTMNPATFLRVLGPEPWHVGYVEPSIRPDDGRYGENPNRFQQHTQFQVILKPDPGNPVELYLESLEALGIDPRAHDIRLVEDNWEQPAISAWGLGWEIWLDGQEITQFTYFQQVGGQTLDPVAVEITYGLERILIALRNAASIWDEPWNSAVRYGEVRRRDEYEHSKYYFEVADVERLRQMFALCEAEAEACLAEGLVVPAYDYVLKCSHTFNALDTRGAVGVTERQAFFSRMRALARRVADAYAAQRKELEYPLLKEGRGPAAAAVPSRVPSVKAAAPFLLEIGVEELPAGDLDAALAQLEQRVPEWLEELRLAHGKVRIEGTPRRLAVSVAKLAPRQADREEVVKGPPEGRAFGPDGAPTPAAIGFARSKGVRPEDLRVEEIEGGRYAVARLRQAGRSTPQVLAEALPELVAGIKFEKSMRWNASGQAFARPIRWLVALLGSQVVPFEVALLRSGRVSRGLRPYGSPELVLPSAGEYFDLVRGSGIVLERDRRRARIEAEVRKLAASVGGEAILPEELLDEVANLVEKPTALLGSFEEKYLALPREVLISVMEKHQRYFPIQKKGELLPYFVVVRNGDRRHLDLVRQGNEHVVGARFADADFFVREDLKHKLEEFRPRLATLVFQKKLGSMLEKSERIEKLTAALLGLLAIGPDEGRAALRAAHLCKADLVTRMVVEMTSLQGVIGREYALRSGENPAVAEAIGAHYQAVPSTPAGLVVALADRLDSLVGLFAVGLVPSGTRDPFGLRRAALGVVQPLIEHSLHFDLKVALEHTALLQPVLAGVEVRSQVLEFVLGRERVLLNESGVRYDVVEAVLIAQGHDPAAAARASHELSAWVARKDWNTILPAYARCVRITRDQKAHYELKPGDFAEEAERNLYAALQKAESTPQRPGSVDDFLTSFLPMIPEVNAFFDRVLVMAEDPRLRENRLGLLQRIVHLAEGAADLSRLEGF